MENEGERSKKEDGCESVSDESVSESRESWSWNSRSSFSEISSPVQLGWLIGKALNYSENDVSDVKNKTAVNDVTVHDDDDSFKLDRQATKVSELEMMKERFSKLLLGEDMSGSGKGVCPALTLSNAITNLYATVFGELSRLEPLPSEKKSMWRREMEWLLCVSDYIVEMIPSWQTLPNGNLVEVMSSRPRSDLVMNMPALRKLDNMLLEILDEFKDSEFWYVDQGIVAPEAHKSVSFRKAVERQEEKWWLPVPRVPPGGLPEGTRKQLSQKLECATQILKAASAINASALADMEVPESYLENLPKNGKACLGDITYRYITSERFSSDCLIDSLDLSSEHAALDMANRVEAAIYVWTRKHRSKPSSATAKSSWEIVRDLMNDGDRRGLLVKRAENLLTHLKQRFPGLTQTTLDASKIHCNKDVGKSILESYSRILECLAFKIMDRIEDLLYVDDMSKQTAKLSSLMSPKQAPVPFQAPVSGTPFYRLPNFSPASQVSPTRGEKSPFLGRDSNKPVSRGSGVKSACSNYICGDVKVKDSGVIVGGPAPVSFETNGGATPDHPSVDAKESSTVDDESRPNRYYMYSSFR